MRKPILFAAACLLAAGLAGGSASALFIESKPYIGAIGDLTTLCPSAPDVPAALGIGGNCFAVSGSDSTITVSVDDDLVADVGFQVGFFTATGGRLGAFQAACNDGVFDVPTFAVTARVFIAGPSNGPMHCAGVAEEGPLAGVGIAGEIHIVRQP